MIIQNNNDIFTIVNSKEKWIIINGVKYQMPKKIKGNNVTQINGNIYIDGYEFIDGKFKKTWKALFHLFF